MAFENQCNSMKTFSKRHPVVIKNDWHEVVVSDNEMKKKKKKKTSKMMSSKPEEDDSTFSDLDAEEDLFSDIFTTSSAQKTSPDPKNDNNNNRGPFTLFYSPLHVSAAETEMANKSWLEKPLFVEKKSRRNKSTSEKIAKRTEIKRKRDVFVDEENLSSDSSFSPPWKRRTNNKYMSKSGPSKEAKVRIDKQRNNSNNLSSDSSFSPPRKRRETFERIETNKNNKYMSKSGPSKEAKVRIVSVFDRFVKKSKPTWSYRRNTSAPARDKLRQSVNSRTDSRALSLSPKRSRYFQKACKCDERRKLIVGQDDSES